MCGCDGEGPRVFEQRWRKATARSRELHRCCECRRTIQLDEWHQESSGYWESWSRYRTCQRCVARREAWSDIDGCAPAFGQLIECILEPMVNRCMRVRHIDRVLGREYLRGLRVARESVRATIAQLGAQRAERRRNANIARWAKRAPTHLGEGI